MEIARTFTRSPPINLLLFPICLISPVSLRVPGYPCDSQRTLHGELLRLTVLPIIPVSSFLREANTYQFIRSNAREITKRSHLLTRSPSSISPPAFLHFVIPSFRRFPLPFNAPFTCPLQMRALTALIFLLGRRNRVACPVLAPVFSRIRVWVRCTSS